MGDGLGRCRLGDLAGVADVAALGLDETRGSVSVQKHEVHHAERPGAQCRRDIAQVLDEHLRPQTAAVDKDLHRLTGDDLGAGDMDLGRCVLHQDGTSRPDVSQSDTTASYRCRCSSVTVRSPRSHLRTSVGLSPASRAARQTDNPGAASIAPARGRRCVVIVLTPHLHSPHQPSPPQQT